MSLWGHRQVRGRPVYWTPAWHEGACRGRSHLVPVCFVQPGDPLSSHRGCQEGTGSRGVQRTGLGDMLATAVEDPGWGQGCPQDGHVWDMVPLGQGTGWSFAIGSCRLRLALAPGR